VSDIVKRLGEVDQAQTDAAIEAKTTIQAALKKGAEDQAASEKEVEDQSVLEKDAEGQGVSEEGAEDGVKISAPDTPQDPPQYPQRRAKKNPEKPSGGRGLKAAVFFTLIVFLGLIVVSILAFMFGTLTMNKVSYLENSSHELEILIDEQSQIIVDLKDKLDAVEREFRGAFKLDRGTVVTNKETIEKQLLEVRTEWVQGQDELRNTVQKYTALVTDNEEELGEMKKNIQRISGDFDRMEEEFKRLRRKIIDSVVQEMP